MLIDKQTVVFMLLMIFGCLVLSWLLGASQGYSKVLKAQLEECQSTRDQSEGEYKCVNKAMR